MVLVTLVNPTEDWIKLEKLFLEFEKPAANANTLLVAGEDLQIWMDLTPSARTDYSAMFLKNLTGDTGGNSVLGRLAGDSMNKFEEGKQMQAEAGASSISVADFQARRMEDHRGWFSKDHLLYGPIIVPPGLEVSRFVVFNSRKHKETGLLYRFKIHYQVKGEEKVTDWIKFRSDNRGNYTWQPALAKQENY